MHLKSYVAALTSVAVLALGGLGGTASAQTTQNGLVNISLSNVTVQVPIGVAANVCDVTVAVLSTVTQSGNQTSCTAVATSTAMPVMVGGAPSSPTTQNGLVNVSISNTTIQVPIAAAINLCGVNAAILAVLTQTGGGANCNATVGSSAGG